MKKKQSTNIMTSKRDERLELFAIVALHAYLIMNTRMDYHPATEAEAAEHAISYAKELIALLDKEKAGAS